MSKILLRRTRESVLQVGVLHSKHKYSFFVCSIHSVTYIFQFGLFTNVITSKYHISLFLKFLVEKRNLPIYFLLLKLFFAFQIIFFSSIFLFFSYTCPQTFFCFFFVFSFLFDHFFISLFLNFFISSIFFYSYFLFFSSSSFISYLLFFFINIINCFLFLFLGYFAS